MADHDFRKTTQHLFGNFLREVCDPASLERTTYDTTLANMLALHSVLTARSGNFAPHGLEKLPRRSQ